MRKNKDLQKDLDEQKYFESQKQGRDMSGKMEYCRYCVLADKKTYSCPVSQKDRETLSQCAKASNLGRKSGYDR